MKKPTRPSEGSIYQTRDGRWRCAITIGYDGRGKQKRITRSAKTKSEIVRKRNQLLQQIEAGIYADENKMTVSQWLDIWVREYAQVRYAALSVENTGYLIRRLIKPAVGEYRLTDLHAAEIRELHAYCIDICGVAASTTKIAHRLLGVTLQKAVEQGIIEKNPCSMVPTPVGGSQHRDALTPEQVRKIITTAIAQNDPLASMWIVALLCGLRRSELIGMEWDRVNLDTGMMEVSWQMIELPWRHGTTCDCSSGSPAASCSDRMIQIPAVGEYRPYSGRSVFSRPKTASGYRHVPIPEQATRMLSSRRQENGLVWVNPKTGGVLSWMHVNRLWRRAVERAGVPHVPLHAARHTAASMMLEAGVSAELIIKLVGHSSVLSTRRYLHSNPGMARAAIDSVGGLLAANDSVNES